MADTKEKKTVYLSQRGKDADQKEDKTKENGEAKREEKRDEKRAFTLEDLRTHLLVTLDEHHKSDQLCFSKFLTSSQAEWVAAIQIMRATLSVRARLVPVSSLYGLELGYDLAKVLSLVCRIKRRRLTPNGARRALVRAIAVCNPYGDVESAYVGAIPSPSDPQTDDAFSHFQDAIFILTQHVNPLLDCIDAIIPPPANTVLGTTVPWVLGRRSGDDGNNASKTLLPRTSIVSGVNVLERFCVQRRRASRSASMPI